MVEKFGTDPKEVAIIVGSIILNRNWTMLNYDENTVSKCMKTIGLYKSKFFDTLIIETMKENSISRIITENAKDFEKVEGITVINPFK